MWNHSKVFFRTDADGQTDKRTDGNRTDIEAQIVVYRYGTKKFIKVQA